MKIILFLLLASLCNASEWYVAQNQLGNGAGNSAVNAKSVAWENQDSSWGAGSNQINGTTDTLHLVGTITSQVIIKNGGNAAHPLSVVFEPNAKLSAPFWTTDAALAFNGNLSYIAVDGGKNGVIECTDNGTALRNHVDAWGIRCSEGKFITIRNLTISNLYVRVRGADHSGSNSIAIAFQNTNGRGQNDLLIANCTIHDAYVGASWDYGIGDRNFELSGCTIYNCNWSGGAGDRGKGVTLAGLYVHDNWFYGFTNWDDTASNNYHHNGFYAFAESGGTLINPRFENNRVGPGFGGPYQTSGLFISGMVQGSIFKGNKFTANKGEYANGMIEGGSGSAVGVHVVDGNTFTMGGAINGSCIDLKSQAGMSVTITNNTADGGGGGNFISHYYSATTPLKSDYNTFANFSDTPFINSPNGSGQFLTFAQWQAAGYDLHSNTVVPPVVAPPVITPPPVVIPPVTQPVSVRFKSSVISTDGKSITITLE